MENIAFRVTLNAATTVVQLGDAADTSDAHFARDDAYWRRSRTHVAFPPYWFFMSDSGRQVLERRIAPARSIGIHVPDSVAPRSIGRQFGAFPGANAKADEGAVAGGDGTGARVTQGRLLHLASLGVMVPPASCSPGCDDPPKAPERLTVPKVRPPLAGRPENLPAAEKSRSGPSQAVHPGR